MVEKSKQRGRTADGLKNFLLCLRFLINILVKSYFKQKEKKYSFMCRHAGKMAPTCCWTPLGQCLFNGCWRPFGKSPNKREDPLGPFPTMSPDDIIGCRKVKNPCQPIGNKETHWAYSSPCNIFCEDTIEKF
jgi:hypothetical protein